MSVPFELDYTDCPGFLKNKFPEIHSIDLSIFWKTRWAFAKARKKPFVIAFTGASSCGKSYLARLLTSILSQKLPVSYFTQDNYYRDFKKDYGQNFALNEFYNMINFDDPNHIQFHKLFDDLTTIKNSELGDKIYIPKIKFGTDEDFPYILENGTELDINPIIITEGVYSLVNPEINDLYDLKIFIKMEDDVRKDIWETRNKKEGRHYTENNWTTTIDAFHQYISPTEKWADLVLDNTSMSAHFKDLFEVLFEFKTIYS